MPDAPVRIACFGDSLTEGYGLAVDEALPPVLEEMLRRDGFETDCLNFGVSGETAADGLTRIQEVLDARPDMVIVEFGANDCFVGDPVPAIRANLATIIETLQDRGLPILLVGISALPLLVDDPDYRKAFNKIFDDLAKTYSLPLFPDILSCYFGHNDMTLMDGLHPSALGVEAIASHLLPLVRDLLVPVD